MAGGTTGGTSSGASFNCERRRVAPRRPRPAPARRRRAARASGDASQREAQRANAG